MPAIWFGNRYGGSPQGFESVHKKLEILTLRRPGLARVYYTPNKAHEKGVEHSGPEA